MSSLSSILLIQHTYFSNPYGKLKNKEKDIALKMFMQYMHLMIYYL